MTELELQGPCPWWADSAHRGRWRGRDVVAWLGAEVADDAAAERARERAQPWLGRSPPGVVPLLGFELAGRRPAWVYEPPDGVSAAVLASADRDGLPLRVATELAAGAAVALAALGDRAHAHAGPELHHVLVSPTGRLALSHLAGPGPRSPACREPRGRDDDVAVVWRLGVLLAQLLTGQAPPPVTDPSSHDAADRRLTVRMMARGGPPAPPELRAWLSALLALEPLDRPALALVGPGLTELAVQLPGPGLVEWTLDQVPVLRARAAQRPAPPALQAHAETTGDLERRPDRTEEVVLGGDLLDDDDTALSADAETTGANPSVEPGAIPVGVGPPAELLRRLRPTPLPAEHVSESMSQPLPVPPRYRALVVGAVVGLALVGLLTTWLLIR